jgi:CubicO group peptidase (beta-lactamase class C family)
MQIPNQKQIEKIIQNHSVPEPFSGVVRLTKAKDVLFEGAYGEAIRSEHIPNRIDTRFQSASGSKIFTSIAVCKMVETGKLQFDTRLSDCLAVEFPNFDPHITVHQLLTHSSGITSYFEEDPDPDYEALWQKTPMYRVRSPKDFLPLFRYKTMKFSPGERFEYNDGGYILLGLILEAVSGKTFPDIIQESVFDPAGMRDSGYFPADQLPERTAYAYIQNTDGSWRTNFFAVPVIGAPDGGAYTTALDLAKFWEALFAHDLLNPDLTAVLLQPQVETTLSPPYTHYGYGVWIEKTGQGIKKFFVEGYDPGVSLRCAKYPAENLTLTLVGNTADSLWGLLGQIEEAFGLGAGS